MPSNGVGRSVAGLATGLLALASLAACGSDDSSGAGTKVTLHVIAASSLTESFTELGHRFEKNHPGTHVELNFGPSSGLAEQIGQGAPADVFASASPGNLDPLVASGEATDPKVFAKNSMEIVVPTDDPAKVTSVKDLARSDVK